MGKEGWYPSKGSTGGGVVGCAAQSKGTELGTGTVRRLAHLHRGPLWDSWSAGVTGCRRAGWWGVQSPDA